MNNLLLVVVLFLIAGINVYLPNTNTLLDLFRIAFSMILTAGGGFSLLVAIMELIDL